MELKLFDIIAYEDVFLFDTSFLYSYVSLNYAASEKKQQQLADYLGIQKLTKAQQQFYSQLEYISIEYYHRDAQNHRYSYGNCLIPSIEDICKGNPFSANKKKENHLQGFLWDATDDEAYRAKLQNSIIIDYISLSANTFTIGKIEENEFKLYICLYPNYIVPLTITLLEYVQYIDEFRATSGWQFHFIDTSKLTETEHEYLKQIRIENIAEILKNAFASEVNIAVLPELPFSNTNDLKNCFTVDYFSFVTENFKKLEETIIANGGNYQLKTAMAFGPKIIDIHAINKVEHIIGRKLPDAFINFYSQYNGFELDWKADHVQIEGYTASGRFEIVPFQEIFGGRNAVGNRHWKSNAYEGSVVMNDVMDEETLAIARECYPMLFSEFIDIVMRFPKEGDIQLYGIIKGNYTPLTISFEACIKLIIKLAGIDFWYILLPAYKHLRAEEHFPAIDAFIKELFPDIEVL